MRNTKYIDYSMFMVAQTQLLTIEKNKKGNGTERKRERKWIRNRSEKTQTNEIDAHKRNFTFGFIYTCGQLLPFIAEQHPVLLNLIQRKSECVV